MTEKGKTMNLRITTSGFALVAALCISGATCFGLSPATTGHADQVAHQDQGTSGKSSSRVKSDSISVHFHNRAESDSINATCNGYNSKSLLENDIHCAEKKHIAVVGKDCINKP